MKTRRTKPVVLTSLIILTAMLGMSARAGIGTRLDVEPADFHAMESMAFTNVTVATFTDLGEAPSESIIQCPSALYLSNYTATIDWGDGTAVDTALLSLNGTGGVDVLGAHTYIEEGNYKLIVSVQDVDGSSGSTNYIAHVIDAPLTGSGLSLTAVEGAPYSGPAATFTDANPNAKLGDFSASISWGDGTTNDDVLIGKDGAEFVVSGTHTYAEEGSYTINVSVLDEGGSRAFPASTINVSDAALSANGTTFSVTEGAPFNEMVATLTDSNTLSVASDFKAWIDWGDGTPKKFGTISGGDGSFVVTGSHTYAEEASSGSYSIKVCIVEPGEGVKASAASTAVVGDAELTPSGLTVPATEGIPFTKVVATFSDANPNATKDDFTATIDWGDGTNVDAVVDVNPDCGCFVVIGNYMFAEKGSYGINVNILDVGGSTASAGATISVSDADLNAAGVTLMPTEGNAFSAQVATFTDANPLAETNDFAATIDWGDGSVSNGIIAEVEGGFAVSGSHMYVDEGTYTINVDIADTDGSTASAGSTAQVQDAPLTAVGRAITPIENASFVAVVASFLDANPYGDTNDFSASIDWGDGVTTSGTIIDEGVNGFAVMGSHTYTNQGMYIMNVSIADGVVGFHTNVVSVANTTDATLVGFGTTFTAVAGVAFTNQVASCHDNDTSPEASTSYQCIINWGDGTTSTGSMSDWGSEGSYGVNGTHTYAQPGSYQVLVTIDNTHTFASTTARSTAIISERPAGNVTSQFQIKASRPRLNKRTGLYQQEVTIKNVGKQPVGGPISLVLDNLRSGSGSGSFMTSSSVTLMNKDGTTLTLGAAPIGSPYKNVSLPKNNVFKGRSARSVVLYFQSPSAAITYDTRVLAGPGAR